MGRSIRRVPRTIIALSGEGEGAKRPQEVIILMHVSVTFCDGMDQYPPDALGLPSQATPVPSLNLQRIANFCLGR